MIFELNLFFFDFICVGMMIVFDIFSCSFSSIVFLISGVVITYRYFYMAGDLKLARFFSLLILFVLSMLILIFRPNLIMIIVGWDGLGLVSFCLIIYYRRSSVLRSGLVSIYVNRLGDMGLMVCAFFMCLLSSWVNISFLSLSSFLLFFFFIFSGMTKSAQIPFSSWLPAAIAAPTPISSLVHSSTLVTAGVYLLVRFNYLFVSWLNSVIFSLFSLSTIIIAGFIAIREADIKKVVAMSTLSQLGLMMFMLSIGELLFSFYHMLTHALFKSLLFLRCGGFIARTAGDQDFRLKGNSYNLSPFFSLLFSFSSLSLCGFPFTAGFCSKDSCIDSLIEDYTGIVILILFLLGCLLTVIYSFRLFYVSISSFSSSSVGFLIIVDFRLVLWVVFLFFFSLIGGNLLGSLFIDRLVNFSFSLLKIVGLIIIIFGLVSVCFSINNRVFLIDFSSSMFFLDYLMGHLSSNLFWKSSFFSFLDLVWLETIGPSGLNIFFEKVGRHLNAPLLRDYQLLRSIFLLTFYFIVASFFILF